ncbi:PAS domain-containing sensor histidine kinase [Neobacillus sp. LXY-1]|uniref:PAS domain-containing sensor histidine kinase n=1 Tax=Neobacillus sp. LXY-1 TaxID=3379133 RepID=UPI003EDF2D9C
MSNGFPIFTGENGLVGYDSEELIDLFLESTADGICMVDMEDRYIRVNQMYTKIFGYTEEDIIGKRLYEFLNPDIVVDTIEAVKRGKSFHNIVTQRYHKNGTELDVAVSYSPFRNSLGEIIAIIAIYRDITNSLNTERELKRTKELYQLITDNTSDLILVFSKDQKIVYVSPSFQKVFGLIPEDQIGRSILDFVKKDGVKAFQRKLKRLLESEEPLLFQHKMRSTTGELVYAEYNITPIFNENNEIESYVSVGRNITERIKNDEAIRNLDRLSIIGQLAAGVAHEIRNPLTSLKGFSKLLRSSGDRATQEYYLSIITDELDRIDLIVNEFMSLAKPQAIQFEEVNLLSIIESTVKILHPQALLHNVQIMNNFHAKDIILLCSPHQLKQVFVNFLKNAIEAMPGGGIVNINVKKLSDNRVQINFKDEGIGIDTELMHFLGTPFYTTKDKGIGLGLTVSNKIIQEHNGTMKIESQKGQGTTVCVELEHI